MPNTNTNELPSSDPLLNRFFLSPAEKADKERGKSIVKAFYTQQTNNDGLSFFKQRNARQIELLLWAKGSQNMKEFLDFMNVSDGNKSYVNIDLTQQRIAAQFVGTLVESLSKTETYPCVKAIDDGSMSEKEERLLEAIFRMREVQTINDVQQQSGIQLEDDNVFIPDDELSAKVYFELQDRLPKEIRFEQLLRKVQKDINFNTVTNRKSIYDLVTLNVAATKIDKIDGRYIPRKCVPTNLVYNFFMNDTGECEITMIGEFYNLKVKDYRSRYGKSVSNPNGLTEKQIFDLAKISTNKNNGKFNYMWDNNWTNTTTFQRRPYDDLSILVFDCEVNCGEDAYYVSKTDTFGKEDIQIKKSIPYQQLKKDGTIVEQAKPDDVQIIKKQKSGWMRGVYAPYGDTLLYWGAPDLIISNYTDTSKSLSSYSINIPNNDGEYVPSLFERIMEPLKEYTLTKLKRKQLIAKVKPTGIRIDVESARNLDIGSGDSIAWEEVVRVYDQTGNELWSSKGIDPLTPVAPPLSNTVRNETIQDIIGLTNILAGIVNEMRMLIGTSVYLEGGDLGDRTAARLAEGQLSQAPNVFGFILNGANQLWSETFYKICLLHWNDIVKKEPESKDDLLNTRFEVSVKMKPSDYEKQLLEQDIQRYSQMPDAQGNPSLTPKDANMLRNIEDFKLAQWYLTTTWESNRRKAMQDSQRLQQQNAEIQQQSAQQNAAMEAKQQQEKLAADKEMKDFESTKAKELALLNGVLNIAAKGLEVPQEWKSVIQLLVPNISIPLGIENDDMEKGLQAKQMEDEMEAHQQQNPQEENQQPQQGGQQMQPQLQQ